MFLSVILLAISLSIDALGVGLIYGIRKIELPLPAKLIICFLSIVYTSIALVFGNFLAANLASAVAKLFGSLILILMGSWILLQSICQPKRQSGDGANLQVKPQLYQLVIKSLGITIQVIRNPVDFDIDRSGSIDLRESLLLGLGLSVDAIGVGIGCALLSFNSYMIPVAVGLFQLCFLYLGSYIGTRFVDYFQEQEKWLSFLPGIILILMALLRLK